MEEKGKNTEGKKLDLTEKLNWEAPKLYCLNTDKTEGGPGTGTETFTSYPS